jgi:hypothetical protein
MGEFYRGSSDCGQQGRRICPRLPELPGQFAQAGRFPGCDFCSTFIKKWKKEKIMDLHSQEPNSNST